MIAAKNPSLNKKLQAHPIFLFPMGITLEYKVFNLRGKQNPDDDFKSKTFGFYTTYFFKKIRALIIVSILLLSEDMSNKRVLSL